MLRFHLSSDVKGYAYSFNLTRFFNYQVEELTTP